MATITKTEIANMALIRLGQVPLLSFETANDRNATIIRNYYELSKQYCLKFMDPDFATCRKALNKLTESPAFEWTNQFELPNDYLSRQCVLDGGLVPIKKFAIEKGKILTNSAKVNLVYTADVDENSNFSPEFVELLWNNLATKIAYPITLSEDVQKSILDEYKLLEDQYPTLVDKGNVTILEETEVEDESNWITAYGRT